LELIQETINRVIELRIVGGPDDRDALLWELRS
jgi:hypothetical protein